MIRIDEIVAGRLWLLLLVQGTACLAAGLAFSYVLRRRPARAHQVLLTALLAAVFMPVLYLSVGRLGLGVLAPAATATQKMAEASVPDTLLDIPISDDLFAAEMVDEPGPWPAAEAVAGVRPSRTAALRVPWNTIVVVCWSVATVLLFLRLILRFLLGWRVVHAAQPWDSEPLRRAVDAAKGRLGVNKPIRIRCSGSVRSPVIWCWSREPVLLVQENASPAENRADWTGVFCHEVSHWRRRDHLTGLFTEGLLAAFPWHPLLWWAKDRLLRLSEQACDDWVLATGQNDADYAETLLGLAAERQMAFVPTTMGKGKTMNLRIRRIITDTRSDPRIGVRWAWAVGMLAVGATVGVAVAQPRSAGLEPRDAPPAKVFKERREIEVREPPGTEQQHIAMKRVLERLMRQADEKKEMLGKGNELPEEERLAQQIELKLLVEQIEQLKNRLEAPGRAPVKLAPKKTSELGLEAHMDSLWQVHEELGLRAEKMEREIEDAARDGRDQEVGELKSELERIRTKRAAVERELDELKGKKMDELKRAQADELKRRKLDELKRAQTEVRREIVVRKPAPEEQDREELKLQYLRLRAEKIAKALAEDPDMDPAKAETQQKLLGAIREQIQALEQESRDLEGKKDSPVTAPKREYRILKEEVKIEKKAPDGLPRPVKGPAGDPRVEAELQELRLQMKELHGQMQQMQKLLDRMAEQKGAGTAERPADRLQEYKLEY